MSTRALTALVAVLLLGLPSTASAARAPGTATISSCGVDKLTISGRVAPTGSAARKARGATLEVRFQAMALFGLPKSGAWRNLGRKRTATAVQEFTGLGADSWVGVMSWRYKRGRRTVLSGLARSEPLRIGSSRGRANCIVSEGLKPLDLVAPTLYILPLDSLWHRAPAPVQLLAQDDFSGVQTVRYSLDGGPLTEIRNGSTFDIPNEGAHTVQWSATDVAGNTATRTEIVRVDAAPPSKPSLSRPFSVTSSTTPTFTWSASSDTGAGLKGYFLAIRRADGSLVSLRPFDANTTSVPAPATLSPGDYTATVTAVDNTTGDPWAVESDPYSFRVDPNPDASVSPASGTVLSGNLKATNFTISLDRIADPATVSASTVILDRHLGSGSDVGYSVACSNACQTITVDPTPNALPEGRYVLSLSGVKSEEGAAFANPDAHYAVPFVENGNQFSASLCGIPANSQAWTIASTDPNESGYLDFSWETTGSGGNLQAYHDGQPVGDLFSRGSAGSGTGRITFPLGQRSGSLTFRATANCSGSITVVPLLGTRNP